MKIFITPNFCGCRLCRGSQKIETELDREAADASRSSHKIEVTGGRHPSLLTIPLSFWTAELSSRETPPQLGEWLDGGVVQAIVNDSVHDCWKIRKNQFRAVIAPAIIALNETVTVVSTR